MKNTIRALLSCVALAAATSPAFAQAPAPGPGMFLVKPTAKTPDQVVDAVKEYSKEKKWLFIEPTTVKNGEVKMVKVCIPKIGKILWPLGLQVSAMLPCGNLGIFRKDGHTQVSMLHPAYMQILYPRPEVEKAVAAATPLLLEMLDAIVK